MNKEWSNQDIVRVSEWSHQYWTASDTAEILSTDENALNQALKTAQDVYKNDRTTTVARVDYGGYPFVLKRYNARNQWHKVKRAFRRSRAKCCWTMSYHFQRAGLNVPQPVLMYESRIGLIRKNAYFVNRFLGGEELLTALPTMPNSDQKEVALAVASAFSIMRQNKISHGDMKASNLIWQDGKLFFIDLDAARKHPSLLSWKQAHKRDKKRFLKNWQANPTLLELFSDI